MSFILKAPLRCGHSGHCGRQNQETTRAAIKEGGDCNQKWDILHKAHSRAEGCPRRAYPSAGVAGKEDVDCQWAHTLAFVSSRNRFERGKEEPSACEVRLTVVSFQPGVNQQELNMGRKSTSGRRNRNCRHTGSRRPCQDTWCRPPHYTYTTRSPVVAAPYRRQRTAF